MGASDEVYGCYRIVAVLRRLARWGVEELGGWWERALAEHVVSVNEGIEGEEEGNEVEGQGDGVEVQQEMGTSQSMVPFYEADLSAVVHVTRRRWKCCIIYVSPDGYASWSYCVPAVNEYVLGHAMVVLADQLAMVRSNHRTTNARQPHTQLLNVRQLLEPLLDAIPPSTAYSLITSTSWTSTTSGNSGSQDAHSKNWRASSSCL